MASLVRICNKLTPKLLLSSLLVSQLGLVACSHKHIDRTPTTKTYHAPAQAYNLNLNNPAVFGTPMLKSSCSVNGSSLEIKDNIGQFYKIDVINTLAMPNLSAQQNNSAMLSSLVQYYANLYQLSVTNSPQIKTLAKNRYFLALPYPIKNTQKDKSKANQTDKPFLGFMIEKQADFVFVIQHLQNQYDEKQMLSSLNTLYKNMSIPGSFALNSEDRYQKDTKDGKTTGFMNNKETLGFIKIDPNTASATDIATWKQKARC